MASSVDCCVMAFLLSMKLAPEQAASNGMSGRPGDRYRAAPHIELNLARQFGDGLAMMSVLEQRIKFTVEGSGSHETAGSREIVAANRFIMGICVLRHGRNTGPARR